MSRHLLSALALARVATALLEGYVELVNVVEEVVLPGVNVHAVNGIIVAAATTDAGFSACATADVILSSCVAAGYLDEGQPTAGAKSCLCCSSTHEFVSEYYTCASYIYEEFPTETEAYTTVSLLYGVCETEACSAPATTTRKSTTAAATNIPETTLAPKAPAGCTSFVSIYASCSDEIPNFTAVRASVAAECFCYNKLGDYNTKFDDYASSCLPWAKTAAPEDYEAISILATICEVFTPTSVLDATGAGGGLGLNSLTGIGSQSISTTPTSTSSRAASSTVTVTVRSSTALAPGRATPLGVVTWVANMATFVLGIFALI
ncbi:hypothetical protein B0T25DRAFT_185388 [Lasiosphaeria hispida]|uniref:Uncharacterized protein n=1 Tax=Lasiosphaeria hispida TaxID=260671 RepID=A0AAJ0MDH5_9PEZI|nr:hypothetical protein B0T25DRAFT_185388 [Lasiosphaeria hispida]